MAALALLVVAAVVLKRDKPPAEPETPVATTATVKLPKLLDLGADNCIPCKMMAPILAEFKRDYADQFITEFIELWKDSEPGKQYGIRAVPTQIFFDPEGKELFRHEGFFGKDDVLNKWKELGVEIRSPATAAN